MNAPPPSTARPRHVVYLRSSTVRQGADGLGVDAQRRAIARYVADTGAEVVGEEFVEIESGRKDDRPQLRQALALARRHRAILLVAKLDRLARSVSFVSSLIASGTDFRAVDCPGANKMVLQLFSVIAEHEADLISARTKAALAAAKARGVKLGTPRNLLHGPPLHVRERARDRARMVAESLRPAIDALRARGVRTLAGTCAAFAADGIFTPAGNAWHPSSLSRALRRIGVPTRATVRIK